MGGMIRLADGVELTFNGIAQRNVTDLVANHLRMAEFGKVLVNIR